MLTFEDITLSINHTTNQCDTTFQLVDNSTMPEQPDDNCHNTLKKLVQKYIPKIAISYINLKKQLANNSLGDMSNPSG